MTCMDRRDRGIRLGADERLYQRLLLFLLTPRKKRSRFKPLLWYCQCSTRQEGGWTGLIARHTNIMAPVEPDGGWEQWSHGEGWGLLRVDVPDQQEKEPECGSYSVADWTERSPKDETPVCWLVLTRRQLYDVNLHLGTRFCSCSSVLVGLA